MEPSKENRCRHAKLAREAARAPSRRHHGLIGLLDRPLRTLIKNPAGLGRDHPARRTHQQANSQPLLKLDNGLRHHRLPNTFMPTPPPKPPPTDDPHTV